LVYGGKIVNNASFDDSDFSALKNAIPEYCLKSKAENTPEKNPNTPSINFEVDVSFSRSQAFYRFHYCNLFDLFISKRTRAKIA
jgi:hypothetical protein